MLRDMLMASFIVTDSFVILSVASAKYLRIEQALSRIIHSSFSIANLFNFLETVGRVLNALF
jgi:hypothetical protein